MMKNRSSISRRQFLQTMASVVTVEQVSQVNDQIYSPSEPLEHDGEGE